VLKLGEEGFNVIPSKELIKEKILNEENEVDFPQ